jgi:hypothetical protein
MGRAASLSPGFLPGGKMQLAKNTTPLIFGHLPSMTDDTSMAEDNHN